MAWKDPISEPQINTIKKLADEKDLSGLPDAQREFLLPSPFDADKQEANLRRMNREQAHEAISLMLELPKLQVQTVEAIPLTPVQAVETGSVSVDKSQTREGYFFIIDPTNNEERFFKVKHGKEGTRWAGYTFLEVQASDYWYPVKNPKHRDAVLAEIDKDPITAMNEYGIRIGSCGVCGRTLTDRDSRLRGIGPVCAARLDMEAAAPTESQLDLLRKLGLHD